MDHLIRSYRREAAHDQKCSPARALMPALDGRSAHRLLYLSAVRDDSYQAEHCQADVDINLARSLVRVCRSSSPSLTNAPKLDAASIFIEPALCCACTSVLLQHAGK